MSSQTAPHDPRWRRLPGERPHQLIEAALEVFSEHGFSAAKLDEIAARAGVSKGTIYLYFESKDDLFKAVVHDVIAEQIRQAHQGPTPQSAAEALERALRANWSVTTHPKFDGWFRLLIGELPKHPDLLAFYNREIIDVGWSRMEQIIARGIASGEFRPMDARMAVGLCSALPVMHRHWIGANSFRPEYQSRDRQQIIDAIVDFALAALRNPDFPRPYA